MAKPKGPHRQKQPPGQSRGAKPPQSTRKQPLDEFALMSDKELLACLGVTVDPERRAALLVAAQKRGLAGPKK